jgi:hypothetical protein
VRGCTPTAIAARRVLDAMAGKVYVTMMRGPFIRIGVAVLLAGAAAPAAAQQSGGTALRASFGADVDAWPFGFAFEGGLWLDHGLWMAGAHARLGALRKEYYAASGRDRAAALGSYGVQIGLALPAKRVRPFVLVGYERLGTSLYDAEGFAGGGRTQQALNLEVGGRLVDLNCMELLVGARGSLGIVNSTTEPASPPFPIAAFVLTVRSQDCR